MIANEGVKAACATRPELIGGINCAGGKLTCPPVADAHGMESFDPAELI